MELTAEQRTNLKRTGIAIAVLVLVSVGSFTAGRFSAPLEVKTVEVERWKTLDIKTEDITRGMTFATEVKRTVYKNVVTTVSATPDAGTTTTITDNSIEHVSENTNGSATESERRVEVVEVEREVVREKIVTLRPNWRVGVLVGASLREPLLPIAGPLVAGPHAELRIAQSPFMVGVWVLTAGSAGVSFSGEF